MTTAAISRRLRGLSLLSIALAAAVLFVCFYYAFAYVLFVPYPGLDYNSRWTVLAIDTACVQNPALCGAYQGGLAAGDRLTRIGQLSYAEYQLDRTQIPFAGYGTGELVPVEYVRDDHVRSGVWRMLGPTSQARLSRVAGLFLFAFYWLAGSWVLLFLRPRNTSWALLIAVNYLTALWLIVGSMSAFRVGHASLVLRILTCLMAPAYLHLHLEVPSSLGGRGRRYLLLYLYAAGVTLAVVQWWRPFSAMAYNLGLLLTIVGSVCLLLVRLRGRNPAPVRVATRLMLLGIALAFGPGLILWVIPEMLQTQVAGHRLLALATIAIAMQPFFYIYALYKQQLGTLEFRANRLLSLYSFLMLYITSFVLVFVIGSPWIDVNNETLIFSLVVSTVFVIGALFLRAPFQRLIDRLAYGTIHNANDIVGSFVDRISRSLDRAALIELLTREVAPALLIRQSALYLLKDEHAQLLYAEACLAAPDLVEIAHLDPWLQHAGRYVPPDPHGGAYDWVRLSIALQVGGRPVGVWLLGKRDPDDYYPQPDIELLTTLGNQVGIALENARLFENLQGRAAELERAYDELKELDRLKDQFVQNVSHELRTPLTIMQGSAELLLEGMLGDLLPEQHAAIATLAERTRGITRLVNDILTVQQSALDRLERAPVELPALACACVDEARRAAPVRANGKPRHVFQLEVENDLPSITGDQRRLHRVFENLLDNSVKFTPEGGVIKVALRACRSEALMGRRAKPQPGVEVSISDPGVGIPPEQLDRIWRQFYQVDGSSTRRFGGTGLGLAIARSIVDVHGGVIWAESVVGQGSTFRFILPTGE